MTRLLHFLFACAVCIACSKPKKAIVFQTDYGMKDGAVSAIKGVAYGVDHELKLYDLTHEIPPYNVWEASYRLYQSAPFWPAGTVFVSVVDPGVGTSRKSVVLKTQTGQFFITPDNGTLTLVSDAMGIEAIRQIDERVNRRPGSYSSYTFHGRDVYAYTAARLAAGKISFEEVGPLLKEGILRLNYQKPILDSGRIKGNVPVLDIQFGNVWTNIHDTLIQKLGIRYGERIAVRIFDRDSLVYQGEMPYSKTFGEVPEGFPLVYLNSLMNVSLALNMGNFADSFHVRSGNNWTVEIKKGAH